MSAGQQEWGICTERSPLHKNDNIGCHPLARVVRTEGSLTVFFCPACQQWLKVSKHPKPL